MNYGSDETVLDLGRHRYDDLQWHSIKVTSTDDILTMVVDDSTTVREKIQGKFTHLNIDSGIYLGGVAPSVQAIFEDRLKNLRGAFSDVAFNDQNLISVARGLTDPSNLVEVSWDVDPIFEASRDSPIAFLSETSFTSFSHIHPSNERRVSFLLKTESTSGLIMYSSTRHPDEMHFIALEVIDRRLKLTVAKGDTVVTLNRDEAIDDGWHQIDLSVAPQYLELSVNGVRTMERLDEKMSAVYGGLIFLGGVNHKARAVAINQGLDSLSGDRNLRGGIIGCMKSITISSRAYSLRDIHASRLVSAQCDDCTDCSLGSRPDPLTPHSDSSQVSTQLLSINPVTVAEGGTANLTTQHIEIVLDFKQYGIRESQILFYVIEKPRYGLLIVDSGRRRSNEVFTYLDLIGQKVTYINQGSEEYIDEISMELDIAISSRNHPDVPEQIQQKYAFILPVNIRPTNDPPKIVVGNEGMIQVIENTKIRITSDILNAEDTDTAPELLTFIVTKPPNQGYFTRSGQSGLPVTEFTQAEIDARTIWYLHLGTGNVTVEVKVTDGQSSSDPVTLFIRPVPLQLSLLKNTGIMLPVGSFAKIRGDNLTFMSNVPAQDLEIRYDILKAPGHGVIEKQQYAGGEWQKVNQFAQRHIDSGHIRYRQEYARGSLQSDQFSFTVTMKSFTTKYYYFSIQFEQIYLDVRTNNKLTLLDKPFGVLSSENLRAVTNNPNLQPEKIRFSLARAPSMGSFYRVSQTDVSSIDFSRATLITDEFTQADVDNGKIYYRLNSNSIESVMDFSDLRIHTDGASSKILRLLIQYVPRSGEVQFVNNVLQNVVEGAQKAIERTDLFIQTDEFEAFDFTVVSKTKYGMLQLVDPRSSAVIARDITEFTTSDIKDLRLFYKHDDSEHSMDSFSFTAVPEITKSGTPPSNIPEFTGMFEIQMLMRNDNPPERLVNKVFKVVRNGERLITLDDIMFTDPDVEYDTGGLLYTRRTVSNGKIVNSRTKFDDIFEFTQNDIKAGKVLFIHSGADKGRADMYVTDGQFYSNCLLEIEAGEAFISILENSGSLVNRNQQVQITIKNLSIETNINAPDYDIHFVLSEEPTKGNLEVEGVRVNEFNLETLKAGKVMYRHKGGSGKDDSFQFSVLAGDAITTGTYSIEISPSSTQVPPRIVNNRVLVAYVGNRANVIKENQLLVTHTDISAADVEYLVLVLPKHGSLYLHGNRIDANGDTTFTQQDVNDGLVTYDIENSTATMDSFVFDVSNNYDTLRGLEFVIDIVPYSLPFEVRNLSVIEGGMKTITTHILRVSDKYTNGQAVQFYINKPPNFGRIELSTNVGVAISTFSSSDLSDRKVIYIHDNSETQADRFSVSVTLDDDSKESEIENVYVTIEGINDESPVIVSNKGLKVWRGSMTQITKDILRARDLDSSPEKLEYRISAPSNGHVSMVNNTFKPLLTFKQSWIDEGIVVFVHQGIVQLFHIYS